MRRLRSLTPEAQKIFGATYDEPDHLPLIVLDQLGSDAIRQVGRHMIEDPRLKVSDPYEHLEVSDC